MYAIFFCFDRIHFDRIRFVSLGFHSIGRAREKCVHELIRSFIGWFASLFIGCLVAWLLGSFVRSLVASFVGWLVPSLIHLHRHVGGRCLAAACMLLQSLLVHIRKH